MARTYKRDARGRFAGGGGSGGGRKSAKPVTLPARKPGGKSGGGHLLKRQAVKDAKAKLAKMDSADRSYSGTLRRRAQKAAVTRASNALKAAKQGGKVRLSGRSERSGVIRPGRGGARKAPTAAMPKPTKRNEIQQAQRALSRTSRKLENARKTLSEGRKTIEKMRKQGSPAENRKEISRTINRTVRTIARLEDAASRYQTTLQREQDRKNMVLAARTMAKAPDNKQTRKNKIRTQQRKITYITRMQGYEAGRAERAKLRQMLGKPLIRRTVAGVSFIADPAPISRGRKKAMAAATKSQKPRAVTSRRKPKTANDLLTQATRI